jgi:hypothetical protein
MRNYLQNIEIVGATMCYREQDQCRWSLDWLVENCNRVVILMDNWDEETHKIVLEYKNKYPNIIRVIYSIDSVIEKKNLIQGQIKKRFKIRQLFIREQVIDELKKMNEKKKIDLLIWPDSDETFINQFSEILKEFWNNRPERCMLTGFIEPFNNFKTIVYQRMAPHGRIFKFDSTITCLPYTTRTRYFPYYKERGWKVRHIVLHMCHFNEEYRNRRTFFDNTPWIDESQDYSLWELPKDAREMTADELADYQPGAHSRPSKYFPILLKEYIKNNKLN